jgi:hypothetical protein
MNEEKIRGTRREGPGKTAPERAAVEERRGR